MFPTATLKEPTFYHATEQLYSSSPFFSLTPGVHWKYNIYPPNPKKEDTHGSGIPD